MTQETGLRWLAFVALLLVRRAAASKPACHWCPIKARVLAWFRSRRASHW
jgi:hypothetical protein